MIFKLVSFLHLFI